jgi:hypothetical protein
VFIYTTIIMKKSLFTLICLTLIFSSCKKYEEGPGISLRTKKARVVGEWKMEKLFIDDEEILLTPDEKNNKWIFKKDGNYEYQTARYTEIGTWSFDIKRELIFMTETEMGYSTSNKIRRLTNNELWIVFIYRFSKREIHLIKQ